MSTTTDGRSELTSGDTKYATMASECRQLRLPICAPPPLSVEFARGAAAAGKVVRRRQAKISPTASLPTASLTLTRPLEQPKRLRP
ncbi:hypothetical protein L596_030844 [Steinernema carpocapsae]|uniref:Uncharacterized protein n=1 Tax=Steinernema carpocapsae TaxID=34508 RepID=A0A4V6XVJ4_STECR|nr:hypothetical protein L596_030844 [Steinernema carpocapsae]